MMIPPKYKYQLQVNRQRIIVSPGWLPTDTTKGHYLTEGGEIIETTNAACQVTDFIEICPGIDYKAAVAFSDVMSYCIYDADKSLLVGTSAASLGASSVTSVTFTAPEGARYVRFTCEDSTLQIIADGDVYEVNPIVKDGTAITWERETDQRFYRSKWSEKITFVGADYDTILGEELGTEFIFNVFRSNDHGLTYSRYWQGTFVLTDCTINADDKTIKVTPDTFDQYTDILDHWEDEYNLIECAPAVDELQITHRACQQIYLLGDSVVTNVLGQQSWEVDTTDEIDNHNTIKSYQFAAAAPCDEVHISGDGDNACSGTYGGSVDDTAGNATFTLYANNNTAYYINEIITTEYETSQGGEVTGYSLRMTLDLIRAKDGVTLYTGSATIDNPHVNNTLEITLKAAATEASGTLTAEFCRYVIFNRMICDAESINGTATIKLSSNDIVTNNRNYRRALALSGVPITISTRYTTEPTEWGKRDDGMYFAPPKATASGTRYYPIGRSSWRWCSLWYSEDTQTEILLQKGDKDFILKDAYSVAACIKALLSKVAPDITHEETAEYSKLLYSNTCPLTRQYLRLMVTQKTNLLVGEYQTPAQKATTTLKELLDMLANTMQAFWFIDDENRLRIEHISWFKRGGSYTADNNTIGIDVTKLQNTRNGKMWVFGTNEYTFDKTEMPERYQFEWSDEVTDLFSGYPIIVNSNLVTKAKNEDVSISNFTSDVDYMMLCPDEISEDGFALFGATRCNAFTTEPTDGYINRTTVITAGVTSIKIPIDETAKGKGAVLSVRATGDGVGFRVLWYNASGGVVGVTSYMPGRGETRAIDITIPKTATALGYQVSTLGSNTATTITTYSLLLSDSYKLPTVSQTIEGVTYKLQNGYMAMCYLQPYFWTYDLPALDVTINNEVTPGAMIKRGKKQTLQVPLPTEDPDPTQLVRTSLGDGEIDSMEINIFTRQAKTTLLYDTTK